MLPPKSEVNLTDTAELEDPSMVKSFKPSLSKGGGPTWSFFPLYLSPNAAYSLFSSPPNLYGVHYPASPLTAMGGDGELPQFSLCFLFVKGLVPSNPPWD